jgi:transposase-like protein
MQNTTSQFDFTPPYCPNSRCLAHKGATEIFFARNGFTKTHKPPYTNQRYRCNFCQTQFSRNTFSVDFRKKKIDLSEAILKNSMSAMSNNSIAKHLRISEGTVRDRIKVMARQSILFEKSKQPIDCLNEDIAYDGFETFTHSQFSPCYVNTVVGSKSHFIYFNTFSPLNRKGRMTKFQKIKNKKLLEQHGPYPSTSVFDESCFILRELSKFSTNRILFTDEHHAYKKAYRKIQNNFAHFTISSKARRSPSNKLFPVNHLHLLYRHFLSSQRRETIAFQKNEAALMEKIQVMKIFRNFMSSKFTKKNKFDPHSHEWSPAMYIGITDRILNFHEVFGVRRLQSQHELNERELSLFKREYQFSRQKIKE